MASGRSELACEEVIDEEDRMAVSPFEPSSRVFQRVWDQG